MNRKQRREQDKIDRKRRTAEKGAADRIFGQAIRSEREQLHERFGLNEHGRSVTTWANESDSIGSVGLMGVDGVESPIAFATVTANRPEILSGILEGLDRTFERLQLSYVPGFEDKVWFGEGLKLVLTQKVGDFWTIYFGHDGAIDRLIEAGFAHVIQETGAFTHYNEWEVRIDDITRVYNWQDAVKNLGFLMFFARQNAHTADPIPGYEVFIPVENVEVRFLPK